MGTNDGLDAESIFNAPCFGYNYDDLVCLPKHATCNVDQVDLTTQFSTNLQLTNPIVGAPMDSVTEAPMAIALALAGGLGVIHHKCSAEYQAKQVRMVKEFRNGFIMDPFVLGPTALVTDVDAIKQKHGVSTVLITDAGTMGNRLLGIVTSRDIDFLKNRKVAVETVMTPKERLVVAKETANGKSGLTLSEANAKLQEARRASYPSLTRPASSLPWSAAET